MPQETITANDILQRSVDRNRYFRGKLLTVRDLTQEQTYFNSKRWLLNRLLFGSGVICGLQVEKSESEAAILIRAGLALDPLGREVTVMKDSREDLSSIIKLNDQEFTGLKTGYICLSQRDCPKEPAPSLNVSSPCDASCESSRWHETFDVSWDEDASPQPALCATWLNRETVRASDEEGNFLIERTTPVWVGPDEVFEVVVRVTGLQKGATIRISEQVTKGTLIEPTPALAKSGQFPTPPVTLKPGEFFVYVYQVRSPAKGNSLRIDGNMPGLSSLVSTVEVLSPEDARKKETLFDIQRICAEPSSTCVRVAKLTVNFTGGKPDSFKIDKFPAPRFRYSLERVTEMLDCVRASLTAEAGSPRPGHAFVTFNDFDRDAPTPIGVNASPGTGFTYSLGNHTHALRRAANSGLEFAGEAGNEWRINGDVGGEAIRFLNTVKGVTPIAEKDLVTKDYVDAHVAGLDWQESVLDKDLTAPPAAPKDGDRYLLFNEPTEAWKGAKAKGKKNDIANFKGKVWEFTAPDEGTAAFVDDENVAYMFVDGTWMPLFTIPNLAAGDGLVANGAILSVGKGGKGIVVNENDVAVAIETQLPPQAIGPVASAGDAETLSASNHTHSLNLVKEGGLIFEKRGLRIEGEVSGAKINFSNPVGGQEPKEAHHLATMRYVDEHASPITAGDGLVRKENTMFVGQGAGIRVEADSVAVAFDGNPPRPIGAVANPGTPKAAAASDHIHTLPLGERGGLVFDGKGLRIDGIVVGETINFANPVAGSTPKLNEHLATKAYVDQKVVPPASVVAGAGLADKEHTISVGAGDGILVGADSVAVRFSDVTPRAGTEAGEPGKEPLASRHDHSHPRPRVTTGAATGVVTFKSTGRSFSAQAEIHPELGPGHLSVQLALLTAANTYIFLGNFGNGPVELTAEIRSGAQEKPTTFLIRVDSTRFQKPLPNGLQIRWFAYTPEFERKPTEVVVASPIG